GAAVAGDGVTDVGEGLGDERQEPARARISFHRRLADGGAYPDPPVLVPDVIEPDTVDVDDQRGSHESHVQSRDEALPPRDRLRVVATPRQRLERLLEGRRGDVLERRRLHEGPFRSSNRLLQGRESGAVTCPAAPRPAAA